VSPGRLRGMAQNCAEITGKFEVGAEGRCGRSCGPTSCCETVEPGSSGDESASASHLSSFALGCFPICGSRVSWHWYQVVEALEFGFNFKVKRLHRNDARVTYKNSGYGSFIVTIPLGFVLFVV
jgi:hypothetical protein